MPVESEHPLYTENLPRWEKCRKTVAGEEAVKAAGVEYLPKLGGHEAPLGDDETYDLNKKEGYTAYKLRAMFFAGASRTVTALSGAVFRKAPTVTFPATKKTLLESVTWDGLSLEGLAKNALTSTLTTSRCGLLVDMGEKSPDPYIVLFEAEQITNWKFTIKDGRETLTLIVIKEKHAEDSADVFVDTISDQYRVLRLVDGVYTVEVWRKQADRSKNEFKKYVLFRTIVPQVRGAQLDYIPFTFINSEDTSSKITKPPIMDVVDVNLSHYRSSADLEHGLHFTALPTAWAAGFGVDTDLRIGSQTAWVSDQPDAAAGYLEFTGAGLSAIERALNRKERLMAVLGSRLLEEDKAGVESAETHQLRRSGEESILSSVAGAVEEGVTRALRWYAEWSLILEGDILVELNRDFTGGRMDASTITALFEVFLGKGISWSTLIHNYKEGEILPENRTAEDEAELIDNGPTPKAQEGPPMDLDIDDPGNDNNSNGASNDDE